MKVRFNIEYHTQWGQELCIRVLSSLSHNDVDDIPFNKTFPLEYVDNGKWHKEIDLPENKHFQYYYILQDNNNGIIKEPSYHYIHTDCSRDIYDFWNTIFEDQVFYSSVFTNNLFKKEIKHITERDLKNRKTLEIKCSAPTLRKNQSLFVCGDHSILGSWNAEKALKMVASSEREWSIIIPSDNIKFPLQIKFIIKDDNDKNLYFWEMGDNRILSPYNYNNFDSILFRGFHLRDPQKRWKGSGIAIPVFSLRSENSFGIGEFTDLKLMIDWAEKTGMDIIQMLPINDTTMNHTWQDSYPYNANSIFALHPAYINLEKVGKIADTLKFNKEKSKLNALEEIDYEAVTEAKWSYLREIYNNEGESTFKTKSFKDYFEKNQDWLIPYAAYSFLREQNGTPDYNWWKKHSDYNKTDIDKLCSSESPVYKDIAFYYFIQYHLDFQLTEVHEYAKSKGISLKGDIPIGISRCSVEAWCYPHLFNLNSQAGAPPDDFSVNGQNWGFPTYNWTEMAKDGYKWWKERFVKMADYFDAYRIDHILGFFRIWEIPIKSVQGLLGYFSPALPLSIDDLKYFGFYFNEDFLIPRFSYDKLYSLFRDNTDLIIKTFFISCDNNLFTFSKEFDTQKEIVNFMTGTKDDNIKFVRNELLDLSSDLLFIRDPYQKDKFHPRINGRSTFAYSMLCRDQQDAYDRLYDDFFYHRHNDFWEKEAMEKLPPLLSSTSMLACGEDLGMIPKCVDKVMNQLKILSLEIQRMPKKFGVTFDNPREYPYLSVCTTSTHDMSPLRSWWKENRNLTQIYYNQILNMGGEAPEECTPDICKMIILSHLESPSILSILPLQDWLSINEELRRNDYSKERINIPSNPRHYWRYRMHITLEELIKADSFNSEIKEMNINNNRA